MTLRNVAKVIVTVVMILLIVVLLLGQLLGQPVFVFVETGSMAPTLEPGDGYVAIPAFFVSDIQEGDVILFDAQELGGGEITTHRVDAVTEEGYITKGDANPFTDQDGAEPIVADGQIRAVALQVNGQLVVLPGLGVGVEAVSSRTEAVQDAVFSVFGLDAPDSATLGLVALVLGLILLIYNSLGEPASAGRTRGRSRGSLLQQGVVIIAILTLVVIIPANASMLLPSGVYQYEIISSTSPTDAEHVIQAGGSNEVTYFIQNSGHIPVLVFLEPASDGVTFTENEHYVSRRSGTEVTMTMHAPEETGVYLRFVREYRYLVVLPPSVIGALHAVHPMFAIAAVNLTIVAVVVAVGLTTVGTDRVRMRSRSRNLSLREQISRLF